MLSVSQLVCCRKEDSAVRLPCCKYNCLSQHCLDCNKECSLPQSELLWERLQQPVSTFSRHVFCAVQHSLSTVASTDLQSRLLLEVTTACFSIVATAPRCVDQQFLCWRLRQPIRTFSRQTFCAVQHSLSTPTSTDLQS